MQTTRASDGFFRLVVLAATSVVLFFAVDGLSNFVLSAGVSWSKEIRHGTIAERGVSVAIASISGIQPFVPIEGIYDRAKLGLFVFDKVGAHGAKLINTQRFVDVAWLDSSLYVVSVENQIDLSLVEQVVFSPPNEPILFLLIMPGGFASESGIMRGDRLILI